MAETRAQPGLSVPPTQPPGSRIQELGDRLIVSFRPRRSWGELAFLTFWLVFWTFAGTAALTAVLGPGRGDRAVLGVWLCGWVLGESAAGAMIA